MFKVSAIIIPERMNDGKLRADIAGMVARRIYEKFGGYTQTNVIGCDPHCPSGIENMIKFEIAADWSDDNKRQSLYELATFVCDAMKQQGVAVIWHDGTMQFVGDPTDAIGAPINDAPISHGIAEALARETWPIDRAMKGFDRNESYRREHGARIRARELANRPW